MTWLRCVTHVSSMDKPYCERCRLMKPKTEFWKDRGTPDGLQRRCIPCQRQAKKESRRRNAERNAERRTNERDSTRPSITTPADEFSVPVPDDLDAAARLVAADIDREAEPIHELLHECAEHPGEWVMHGHDV